MVQAEAQRQETVNGICDDAAQWAVAWRHAWTRNTLKLATRLQDMKHIRQISMIEAELSGNA